MIRVDRLTKIFPLAGGKTLTAVDDVSFVVEPGEVYGLLGPNGAGKTTTLRMILGLLKPTSGQSSIAGFGSSQSPDEVKRRVGLVSASLLALQFGLGAPLAVAREDQPPADQSALDPRDVRPAAPAGVQVAQFWPFGEHPSRPPTRAGNQRDQDARYYYVQSKDIFGNPGPVYRVLGVEKPKKKTPKKTKKKTPNKPKEKTSGKPRERKNKPIVDLLKGFIRQEFGDYRDEKTKANDIIQQNK